MGCKQIFIMPIGGAVIKLATEKSEFRKYLVPILQKTAKEFPDDAAFREYMARFNR